MEISDGRIEHDREIVQTRGYNKSKAGWEKLAQEVRKHSVELPEPINSRKDLIFIHSQKLYSKNLKNSYDDYTMSRHETAETLKICSLKTRKKDTPEQQQIRRENT